MEERKEEVRRAGSKTSPSASVQCELRAAAKQTVVWRTEKEKPLAVVCHWVEFQFITRERQLKKERFF